MKQQTLNKKDTGKIDRTEIVMHVKDDSDFLSVFSTTETPVISGQVAEFLDNATKTIHPDKPLSLKIKGDCIDENERIVYKKAIKEYYSQELTSVNSEIKVLNRIAMLLMFFGVIILGIAVFLELKFNSIIWSEVVDIVAWVLLWEAVDIKFFRTRDLAIKRKKVTSFISMPITYEN